MAYALLDNNVGYLRIKAFQGNTAEDVKAAILKMKSDSKEKMKESFSICVITLVDCSGKLWLSLICF